MQIIQYKGMIFVDKIILTGGGTAGHVTPNIALMEDLQLRGFEIKYIGSKNGIEKQLVEKQNIDFIGISSGKLRRYISFKNFTDMFRVVKGLGEAVKIIKKEKPNIVFSKGGFVTVPVVLASKICKVPVVIHESDITPGLANKIALPYSKAICVSFPETLNYVNKNKSVLTGTPIRKELFLGNKNKGLEICGFNNDKPVILVIGGSLGSVYLNNIIFESIHNLTKEYNVVHICGKGNVNKEIKDTSYIQFEYVEEELNHLLALADVVISRAGANFIYEILALKKLNILIPLSKKSSRGDQILNAKSFKEQGFSYVIEEENFNKDSLKIGLKTLNSKSDVYRNAMNKSKLVNSINHIVDIIVENKK